MVVCGIRMMGVWQLLPARAVALDGQLPRHFENLARRCSPLIYLVFLRIFVSSNTLCFTFAFKLKLQKQSLLHGSLGNISKNINFH